MVEINSKEYVIKEITYLNGIEIEEIKQKEGLVAATKKLMELATNLSSEEIDKLSMKDGLELQKEINNFNELGFQEPIKEEKQN